MHDWGYYSEASDTVEGRAIEFARGRVVGGSSSINAMAYVRGHAADYDRWAERGLEGWDYESVLPYFRRQESWEGGADRYRGDDGPLTVQTCRYDDPLIGAYHAAALEAGHRGVPDYNGPTQEGVSLWQMTIRDGRRCSAARAYLRPALSRPNLRLEVNALTLGLVFDGNRVAGVSYIRNGRRRTAFADGEVVLTAGVVNSPQILMLSGIGPAEDLRRLGIAVRVDLRGVGRNLQDHMSTAVFYRRTQPGPLHPRMRVDRIAGDLANAYLRGRGIANDLPAGVMAFLRTQDTERLPDVQLMLNSAPLTARPYLSPFVEPYADGFAVRIAGLRPSSRGHIELASADPLQAPLIHSNHLSAPEDIAVLRRGIRIARVIACQSALEEFVASETAPGTDVQSDDEIDAYIRRTGITVHHPAGTCRMGGVDDEGAVVDDHLRVHGVDGLRVVDASVMPDLVGGNINASVIMIAEKAADMIRSRDAEDERT